MRVEADAGNVDLGSPQQRVVLAALAMAEGRIVSTARLIDAVWGTVPPASALVTMRTYVSRLRGALGASTIVTDGVGYRLCDVDLDLVEAARQEAAADATPAGARAALDGALACWTGEPLAGLPGLWADAHRARLSEWRIALLERRLRIDIDAGNAAAAIAELSPICERNPLRESAHGLLMLALHRAGRRAEALEIFERLRHNLNGQPDTAVRELHRTILRGEDRPEPTDAGPGAREPLAPAPPPPIDGFVGRSEELARLEETLRPGDRATVVAVSGIAGTGKTALARQAAHLVGDRFDGALFADLRGTDDAPVRSEEVLSEFLRALGIDDAVLPPDREELVGLYRSSLADRRLLILLDDADDAAQLRPLLPGAPGCAVLVTSRRRLSGDPRIWLEAMEPADARRLFTDAAGAAGRAADAEAVARVVELCGRLPLAVRIAAERLAREPGRTLGELERELTDVDTRLAALSCGGENLAARFAASYRRLDADTARGFRLLAVPDTRDWDAEAAAAVLGTDARAAEDLLEELVDLGLMESRLPGEYRYRELLWCYARTLASPAEAAAAAHELAEYRYARAADDLRALNPDLAWRIDNEP